MRPRSRGALVDARGRLLQARRYAGPLLALDNFFGRGPELRELCSLLGHRRLVTVTGPPGVGKSRLAMEAAAQVAEGYVGGVVIVSFSEWGDPTFVPSMEAESCEARGQHGRTALLSLAERLRRSQALVILDDCDHVTTEVAELAEMVLRAGSEVTILTTSRQALGVSGETVSSLAPLPLPQPDDDLPTTAASPAVALFWDRARALSAALDPTGRDLLRVGEICRRVDGLPLAIELAAAQMVVLSLSEIVERLDGAPAPLGVLRRDVPVHHRSLRAALDWSYQRCDAGQQAMLRRLSVFSNGATTTAAATVFGCGDDSDAADLLDGLVARSLLSVTTGEDQVRYRMMNVVRGYAAEKLAEAVEEDSVRGLHARSMVALAEACEPQLTGAHQAARLAQLRTERADVCAALEWALQHGHAELALRLAGALVMWWRAEGSFSEGRSYLTTALSLPGPVPLAVLAKAWWAAALLAVLSGDAAAAREDACRALDAYRNLGDARGVAHSLLLLGNCNIFEAPATAAMQLEEVSGIARQNGDDWCLAHAVGLRARVNADQGALHLAYALAEDAVALARRGHDAQGLRTWLPLFGQLCMKQGLMGDSEAALLECLAVSRQLGETYSSVESLALLGELALIGGEVDSAGQLIDEALVGAEDGGTREQVLEIKCLQGRLALWAGDSELAFQAFDAAASMASACKQPSIAALCGLAQVAALRDETTRAVDIFEEALDAARGIGNRLQAAVALSGLADLVAEAGDYERGMALRYEALELRHRAGEVLGVIESLEAIAAHAADAGRRRAPFAARVMGAAQTHRAAYGFARSPAQDERTDQVLNRLHYCLGSEPLEAALDAGAKWSISEAVAYARRRRDARSRPTTGWASLTRGERQIARLAAMGYTNRQIADQLRVDPATPKSHLRNVFAKLGIRSRVELVARCPADELRSA